MNEHVKIALLIALQTIEDEDARNIILGDLDLSDDYVMAEVLPALLNELKDESHEKYEYGFAWYKKNSEKEFLFRNLIVGIDDDDLRMLMVEHALYNWHLIHKKVLEVWDENPSYKDVLVSIGNDKGKIRYNKMKGLINPEVKHSEEAVQFHSNILKIFNTHADFEYLTLEEVVQRNKENLQ